MSVPTLVSYDTILIVIQGLHIRLPYGASICVKRHSSFDPSPKYQEILAFNDALPQLKELDTVVFGNHVLLL